MATRNYIQQEFLLLAVAEQPQEEIALRNKIQPGNLLEQEEVLSPLPERQAELQTPVVKTTTVISTVDKLSPPPETDYRYASGSGLLNALELSTVLEMLAAIQAPEELDFLEFLTPTQKYQVWRATPEFLKVRLLQFKQSLPQSAPPPIERSPSRTAITIGDRVVLKARPELGKVELLAIFEVVAIQDKIVQCKIAQDCISQFKTLGISSRRYPMEWLLPYPPHSAL